MFSKKTVMIICVILLVAVNIIILFSGKRKAPYLYGPDHIAILFVAPFQKAVTRTLRFAKDIWRDYFFLVSVAKTNDELKKALGQAIEKTNRYKELKQSNVRLRKLLKFRKAIKYNVLAAEVIGRDPSFWSKSITIDKGYDDGVNQGMPVVMLEGIVGLVTDVSNFYSKVLLITDQNSAVDALVQETRARGIIKGKSATQCYLDYVLRKHEVRKGNTVVSSGLDGVFPKGLRVGEVSIVSRDNSGIIFQNVVVTPYVDFETLEEVLVILNAPNNPRNSEMFIDNR